MTNRGKEIPDLDATALVCATQCPRRFWAFTNTKSEPNYWSSSEDLNYSLRIAVRLFYNEWNKLKAKPTIERLMHYIRLGYNSRSRRIDNHASVMKKMETLATIFVNEHPDIAGFSLIGQSFAIGYPPEQPQAVINDVIDLMYTTSSGTEEIIVISTDLYPPRMRLREYIAYLGYTNLRKGVIPSRIISFTMRGFEVITIEDFDDEDMRHVIQLARWLYTTGNQTRHSGITCNTCGYNMACRTW